MSSNHDDRGKETKKERGKAGKKKEERKNGGERQRKILYKYISMF